MNSIKGFIREDYNRKHRIEHREEIQAYNRKYYKSHITYAREYYENHKEEFRARSREYNAEHKEELKGYGRKYRIEHRKERLAYARKLYENNKEGMRAYYHMYRVEHKEMIRASQHRYYRTAKGKLVQNRVSAKRSRDLSFVLLYPVSTPCFVTGSRSIRFHHYDDTFVIPIDRKLHQAATGYTRERHRERIKSLLSPDLVQEINTKIEEFLRHCRSARRE